MACFIMTGEIMGGEKYGGISPKTPIFPGHNCTCDFFFPKFSLNFKIIYPFLSVPDAFASTIINDNIRVFIVQLNRVSVYHYIFLRPTVCYKIKQVFRFNNRNSCHK